RRQNVRVERLVVHQPDGETAEYEGENFSTFNFSDSHTYLYLLELGGAPQLVLHREGELFDLLLPLDDFELADRPMSLPWGQFFVAVSTASERFGFIIDPTEKVPVPILIEAPGDMLGVYAPSDATASRYLLVVGSHTNSIVEVPSGAFVASLQPWGNHELTLTPDGAGLIAAQETSATYVPFESATAVQLYQGAESAFVRIPPRWPLR